MSKSFNLDFIYLMYFLADLILLLTNFRKMPALHTEIYLCETLSIHFLLFTAFNFQTRRKIKCAVYLWELEQKIIDKKRIF